MVVSTPSPEPGDDKAYGEQIGWRRRYYDVSDGGQLALGMALAATSTAPFAAAILASHRSMVIFWGGLGLLAVGGSIVFLTLSGAFNHRPNAAIFHHRAFRIGMTISRHPILGALIGFIGATVTLIGVVAADRAAEMTVEPGRRILIMVALLVAVAFLAVVVAGQPFDRRLELSPEGLSFRLGHQEGLIPWGSITSMQTAWTNPTRGLTGRRIRDGILFDLTDEAHFQRILPHPGKHFRLQTVGFDVDEDTLYNVIDALHAHPELRELAGREEGSVLFVGPPRDIRKRLRRTQVWLPWERGIQAALADGADSGDDDRRDLTDHA